MPTCPPQRTSQCAGRRVFLFNVCLATKDHETLVTAQNTATADEEWKEAEERAAVQTSSAGLSALLPSQAHEADICVHAIPQGPSNLKP